MDAIVFLGFAALTMWVFGLPIAILIIAVDVRKTLRVVAKIYQEIIESKAMNGKEDTFTIDNSLEL